MFRNLSGDGLLDRMLEVRVRETMSGAWPPGSSDTRFIVLAAPRMTNFHDLRQAGEGQAADPPVIHDGGA